MTYRRMIPFLLLNIFVSAAVTLSILWWWDGRQPASAELDPAVALVLTPVATPTIDYFIPATDTPEPTAAADEIPIHVVRGGDTLATIALLYGVSVSDLQTINNITDPNLLQIGQELRIPVGGLPTPTPTPPPTATPNIVPSPIPTEPLSQGEAIVRIQEVIGVGSLADEAVAIINEGSRPVALQGWKIRDAQGAEYTFGQVTLFGDGGGILLHTTTGQNSVTDLYWGLAEAVWSAGEVVTLLDSEGTEQASLLLPLETPQP